MHDPRRLTPLDLDYPTRLSSFSGPPVALTVQGGSLEADRVVAVVGSRHPTPESLRFTSDLAAALAREGVVVASGGAAGIDGAAHQATLEAGGRTWAVAGTGHGRCYPAAHRALFESIARGPGSMIWPFPAGYHHVSGFPFRNRVLTALADAVVVVQAGASSGALHAARCAYDAARPLWVVPAFPWASGFEGSLALLNANARPLTSIEALIEWLRRDSDSTPSNIVRTLVRPERTRGRPIQTDLAVDQGVPVPPMPALSTCEIVVLDVISHVPLHIDSVACRADRTAQATAAALLTLALENVVVEGPPGFFRRRVPRKP